MKNTSNFLQELFSTVGKVAHFEECMQYAHIEKRGESESIKTKGIYRFFILCTRYDSYFNALDVFVCLSYEFPLCIFVGAAVAVGGGVDFVISVCLL